MSLKKSNKCIREATDKEYSKNNSPQSVDIDVETYDGNNYIGEKKLEFFSSQDDHTSEYCTNTSMYILINIIIKRLTTPTVYTVIQMFSQETLLSIVMVALKRLSGNLKFLRHFHIDEKPLCAMFVVNHFCIETYLEKVCCYDISKS